MHVLYMQCIVDTIIQTACMFPPIVGSSVIPIIVYLASNIFFTYLDLTGRPAALLKYKIQEEKGVPVRILRAHLILGHLG